MKTTAKIASIIFALVSILHFARVVLKTQVMIDDYELPIWVSILGFIVPGLLSIALWRQSK